MTRREFIAAVSAAGLLPFESLRVERRFPFIMRSPILMTRCCDIVEPGSDEFKGEKDAVELEARLERIFAGREAAPPGLSAWVARRGEIRDARFYALPEAHVRYEIKTDDRVSHGRLATAGFQGRDRARR